MNVKLKLLSAGVLFFLGGQSLMAQKDSLKVQDVEEVVVVGYMRKKASEVVGSTQKLSSGQISAPSAQTVESALQGQASGVQVATSSGTPGAVQDVRIRGIATVNSGASPLYVIDGVPVSSGDANSYPGQTQAVSTFSVMSTINQNDIESVTVLKDASATAQYGARGSNGVILITTKKGKRGKTKYSFDTNIGFQNIAFDKRHGLTGAQREELLIEGLVNDYKLTPESAVARIVKNNYGNYNGWVQNGKPANDWWEAIQNKDAFLHTYNFSASGGNNKNTFYASLGYNETEAVVIGPSYKRMTGKLSYTNELSERAKLETSLTGSFTQQNPILDQSSYFANPFITRILMTPWANPTNQDGTANTNLSNYTSIFNPIYLTQENKVRTRVGRVLSNNKISYDLTKDLTFTQVVNIDYLLTDNKDYRNRVHGDGANKNGTSERSFNQAFTFVSQSGLNYSFNIGNEHRFNAMGLFEYIKNTTDYVYAYGDTFPADGLTNVASAGANYAASSRFLDSQNAAYLAILNYTYNNRLILDGSFRREGSSKFATGNRFGNFWSVGGAYNLHRDVFSDFFNELKIRASYGLTGNSDINLNQYQALLAFDYNYNGEGAAYPSIFGNSALTWEKQKLFDAGVDFSFWDRRVTGGFSYYNKDTYDVLLNVPLSRTTAFNEQLQNVGAVNNKGIEVDLSVDVIKTSDFTFNLFGQVGTVKNKVTELAKDTEGNDINPQAGSSYKTTEVGLPIGSWYMRTWAGVDPETGSPTWYKTGTSGEVTSNYNDAERSVHGSPIPKYSGGFGAKLNFKNWYVNSLFSFAGGHKIYEQYAQFYMRTNSFSTRSYNGDQELLNRWQKPGDITNVPKMNYATNDFFHSTSTRHLYDGDFIRLRDLTVGYNIYSDLIKSTGIEGISLSVRGSNLWTWVKDKNLRLDPEVRTDGYTRLTTPPVKTISFGATINF